MGRLANNKKIREKRMLLSDFLVVPGTSVVLPRYKGGTTAVLSSLLLLYDFSSAFLIVLHTRSVRQLMLIMLKIINRRLL